MDSWCFSRFFATDGGVAGACRAASSPLLVSSILVDGYSSAALVNHPSCIVARVALLLLPCLRGHGRAQERFFVGAGTFASRARCSDGDGLLDARLERAELVARMFLAGFERWLAPGHSGAGASDFKGLFQ